MALSKSRILVLGAAFALAGCSFASDALFPSLGGPEGTQQGQPAATGTGSSAVEASPDASLNGPPSMGSTNFVPGSVTPGSSTGTFVGQKVQGFRGELRQLQDTVRQRNQILQSIRNETVQDSQRYHETIATVNARLQVGTTPGNPVLNQKWSMAQGQLDKLNQDIAGMNQLATQVASDSAMAAYLLDSVRAAYGLSGAVEEDHRQLRILEDETNQTTVLIERLLSELSQDISRQQSYVSNERSNLNTLALGIKNGQMYGASLANQALMRSAAMAPADNSPAQIGNRRPLVVIRFDRSNVAYEQPLYQAVSRAIERRPDAQFDVVAVSPTDGASAGQQALNASAARRSAEQVVRSLSDMGLAPGQIRMSSTTSASVGTNEVHVYVR
ncbi:hypothetical protein SAMN05421779_102617 [Insolitispirillum peregrinum]|uniref:Magnetosome membrane associated protein MmeA n=2 Tax=Insolitispirillum peregrinum TaxID=80876 RepID=A0A1N7K5U4_9PROT|nr:hypothetical protein SAMN05421779_102617 [Insolitispirillum peregrinum]